MFEVLERVSLRQPRSAAMESLAASGLEAR
jgi:hypothetical protein